ncbi:DnaJ domain-containing protein [Mucilaginibacter gossypiicola]|uniref:DnaJ domain-containing protein n=1 Tax=Mucilaginibacter gossypiicola TaxID=551995 RepID=A0A1H8TL16_9SPHI|nr:J domain-containing protein [Mucilaginibacter gossypiicola]SEO91486.1 DnaJ domain-containing protein [Mucilaginibacter gossypiicola]
MFVDYYEILGIDSNATDDQIKKAYRSNAIKFHPDKHFDDPFFTKKFQEIKDAYTILIDADSRSKFNSVYSEYFKTTINETQEQSTTYSYSYRNTEKQERKKTNEQEEERFRHDPFKQFYSPFDREQQETPKYNPTQSFWGEPLPKNLEFFKLPARIGKIIVGFSDLIQDAQPMNSGQKAKKNIKFFFFGLIPGLFIYFIARLEDPLWITIWFAVPSLGALLLSAANNDFAHTNLYIGINGFAQFSFVDKRKNLPIDLEVNFNDMTDFYSHYTEVKRNYVYQHTNYVYVCLNRTTGKILLARDGDFKKTTDIKNQGVMLNFYRTIEKYWTVYLLDRLESDLQKDGYIIFSLYSHEKNAFQKYIKVGIGFITFIKPAGQEFTYKFNDIKKMYSKGGELRIQHKNFEKTLFFFKSGNEDVIPMVNLCNRLFFYKAIEILLGYSI